MSTTYRFTDLSELQWELEAYIQDRIEDGLALKDDIISNLLDQIKDLEKEIEELRNE